MSRAPISFVPVLQAELLRTHRTFTWFSVLVPALVALWSVRLAQATIAGGLSSGDGRWSGNVLGWLSFYSVALALPLGALLGAMAQWREQRCREGGTAWRAVTSRSVLMARAAVLALASAAGQAALILPVLAHALLISHAGWGPTDHYLSFLLLQWLAVTSAALLGMITTRVLGGIGVALTPAAALTWSIAGAAQAEAPDWLLRPWTWLMHGCLPLLGVHGNSTNLRSGDPAWNINATQVIALHLVPLLLMTGAVLVFADVSAGMVPRAGRRSQSVPETVGDSFAVMSPEPNAADLLKNSPGTSTRARPVLAMTMVLPWRTWLLLSLLLLSGIALIKAVYDSSTALGFLSLMGVPVAATIVGVQAWLSVREAWRGLLTRIGPFTLVASCLLPAAALLCAAVTVVAAFAATGQPIYLAQRDAGGLGGPVYVLLTTPFVAVMLLSITWLITQTVGIAWSIALTVFGLLSSLVIAGNEALSASSLWLWAPWGWTWIAGSHPQHWLTIAGLSTIIAGAAAITAGALSYRVARRNPDE